MKAAASRRLLTLLPGRIAMAHLRRCLVALLFALTVGLAGPAAHGADLKEALTRFTADDFSETSTGISEVAESGDPRAATIIEALQAGRLEFSAERKAVYYKNASNRLIDAATGQPAAGDAPADLAPVRLNNRLRRGIDAAIGGLTLMALFAALVLLSPVLVPERRPARRELEEEFREFVVNMLVQPRGPVDGRTVTDAGLRHLQGVFLVEIERDGDLISPVPPTTVLHGDDRLTFVGKADLVVDLQNKARVRHNELVVAIDADHPRRRR